MGGFVSGNGKVDAVLWDLDGTLIDTSSSSLLSLVEILEEFGVSLDLAQITPIIEQQSHTGEKKDKGKWASTVLEMTGLKKLTAEELLKRWDEKMVQKRASIKALPGAIEVVKHLKECKIPQAIVTMSNARSVAVKRKQNEELFGMMDLILTSDDKRIKNRKPHPDCYLLASELLNVKSTRCVVVEDSPEGMRAGKSAGCKVVAVPAAWTKNMGRKLTTDFLITTLRDFPFRKLGLPKMRSIK
ncbi:hypothetical protein TrCOL_g3662 [Triparma columacea]|uniref:Uncharacterized protein n=1 Tax=Triparma columacea TaxID=722753 RepID=A0A9W7GKH8_9STRA|nr:hypothetical protein TrCOL_g3662 [Triparma columacea]